METNTLVKIREAIQTIGTALGATVTALAMILLPCRAATNTVVQTVDLRNVDLDSPVEIVTNVDCEALVDTNQLHIAITNLEEKIAQATPENYSVVSNAAMNALSRAEAEAGFTQWKLSGLPDGATEIVGPDFVESVQQPLYSLFFTYNEVVYEGWTDVSGEDVTSVVFDCADVDDTVPHITVTATRTRLPTMADIPTKTSQLTNDGAPNGGGTPYASTADATLTPIYSTTPTYGDEWICNPADFNGDPITIVWDSEENGWRPMANGSACGRDTGSSDSTSLTWTTQLDWLGDENLTATRVRTDIVGYTLGSQTNKPLQAAGDYAQASVLADVAETATNALETADAAAAAGSTNSANIATLNAQVASIAQSATNYTDSAIASADTSYARFVTLTNVNQSVQFVTLSENDTTLSIELPETGETKDWIVYVLAATNTVLSLPPATWYMTDTANTNAIPAGMTAFYFSQMATGIYMLGRQELEPVTIQGN